jgi:hypothetical protein
MAHQGNSADGQVTRARPALVAALAVAAAALLGCGWSGNRVIGADNPAATCEVTPGAPPASVTSDPFYGKYLDATGVPVLGSAKVQDAALVKACIIVVRMLSKRDDVRQAMVAARMRAAVLARDEVTTDIPEYRDLYSAFPGTDWNTFRGLGATTVRPVSSTGEENLLCAADDAYHGENVLVQTLASGLRIAIDAVDSTFESDLDATYRNAMAMGLWERTYARTTQGFYFTEGVQDWFDANGQASPANGQTNYVNTRAELVVYDPMLAALVGQFLPDDSWRARCN